jgi:hypothetical protein
MNKAQKEIPTKLYQKLVDEGKLFSEVDDFDRFCGTLCSHLQVRHEREQHVVRGIFTQAVELAYKNAKKKLFERDKNHDELTWEYHRTWQANHNYLKASYARWRREPLGSNSIKRGTGHLGRTAWIEKVRQRQILKSSLRPK